MKATDGHIEETLVTLISSLESASFQLKTHANPTLEDALHSTEKLPDAAVSQLASKALDLLSEVQLMLEPGQLVLADHFMGYMNTKALVAAIDLNIPDILAHGPKAVATLAEEAGARPDRFRQIMRTLSNNGIFLYDTHKDSYSNNATSTLLTTNHWTQWRNWVELYGNEFYDMARGLPESLKKDVLRCPAQVNFDTDDSMFKYFTDQGWMPKFFKTLSGGAIAQAPGILEDYPWHEVAEHTVLDLGGGSGGLIALLLRKHSNMKGAVLDLAKSIELCRANFHAPDGQYADVGGQIVEEHLITGNFMEEVPSFEVYTMKWCLHDWSDEDALVILKNIRRAIKRGEHSRLIVLESVLKDGHMGRMARYGDLNMMIAVGGRERDEQQWRNLASQSGWRLERICALRNAWPCALDFRPMWDSQEEDLNTDKVL
ncbi:hypothetical protein SLS60_004319 [Paraconiothyrium brasiliense]|uniref:O-methyltransferase n=1 Tax=Paraconiothyrium brasiliense TaxID=300254 RepID=A0ABR3RJZ8_9PLEO